MKPFDKITSRLKNVKPASAHPGERRALAICPAHDDHHPSLGVRELADGRVLVVCRTGCGSSEIVQAVGLNLSDLYLKNPRVAMVGRKGASRRAAVMRPMVSADEVAGGALFVLLCIGLISEGRTASAGTRLKLAAIAGRLAGAEVVK